MRDEDRSDARPEAGAAVLNRSRGLKMLSRHGRYVVFQLAEVAVPRALFTQILRRIDRLRPRPLLT
jgi:hypothetical protein